MDAKPFDLAGTIADLLRRIDEGRKVVREAKPVSDKFWKAFAKCEDAKQRTNELQRKMVSLDEPAQLKAKAELNRLMSEIPKLTDEKNDLWPQYIERMAFIGPFRKDVSLLLERLPLGPEWDMYRKTCGSLDVRDHGCWTDPPDNSALETLEMRLREMLVLAKRRHGGQLRRFEPFPTPGGATWKDVSMTFISDHRVQIDVVDVRQTRNYAEMGLEDRRGGGGKPALAWTLLKELAESGGGIAKPDDFKRPGWPKVEKQVQTLRARLRELFVISEDPLPFNKRSGYEAKFKIKIGNSFQH